MQLCWLPTLHVHVHTVLHEAENRDVDKAEMQKSACWAFFFLFFFIYFEASKR
jgi:hypothetical protein